MAEVLGRAIDALYPAVIIHGNTDHQGCRAVTVYDSRAKPVPYVMARSDLGPISRIARPKGQIFGRMLFNGHGSLHSPESLA